MITTTYKCDRCGAEQKTDMQMWQVEVYVNHLPGVPRKFHFRTSTSPIWCRKCVDALDLLKGWKPPAEELEQPKPTLEDQIREIIRSEIREAE